MDSILGWIQATLVKKLGPSYRTSLGGIGMILSGAAVVIAMLTGHRELSQENIGIATGLFTGGYAAIQAKDKGVTGIGANATADVRKDATALMPEPPALPAPSIPKIPAQNAPNPLGAFQSGAKD